jgi:NAD(P)-dependent dehydrogenase (short-subunit alcohol dehydrogenase family)
MQDLFNIRGKTALVTGGGRGIGEMIARGYVANGARVYIASRDGERIAALASELSTAGECIALPADLSTLVGIEALATDLAAREAKLDILVNNAGAASMVALEAYDEAAWDQVMDLNAKSVFFLTQKLLPLLRASATPEAAARVINIASVNGLNPPEQDIYAYSSSKAACLMLTRHLAKRLARENILVNAIAPGPFPTDMMAPILARGEEQVRARNPMGRLGSAEDIAGCAIFLASRASGWTTGATIPCDGGAASLR